MKCLLLFLSREVFEVEWFYRCCIFEVGVEGLAVNHPFGEFGVLRLDKCGEIGEILMERYTHNIPAHASAL